MTDQPPTSAAPARRAIATDASPPAQPPPATRGDDLRPAPRWLAPLIAATAGWSIMGLEMALARQIAPQLGTSLPVWASLIGWMLLALALGAALGGRLSRALDATRPARGWRLVGLALCGAAAAIAVLGVSGPLLWSWLAGITRGGSAFASLAALIALALLGSAPALLLAAVSPVLVRLEVAHAQEAGAVAGRLAAASTCGSLAGTLVPAFLLLPALGTLRTFLALAATTAVVGLLALRPLVRDRHLLAAGSAAAAVLIALAARGPLAPRAAGPPLLHEEQSAYYRIAVTGRPDGQRDLRLDAGWAIQSTFHPAGPSLGGSWPGYLVGQLLRADCDTAPRAVLIVGLAGGTTARDLAFAWPGTAVTGVELDPAVLRVGRQWLGLPADTRAVAGDGRRFVDADRERYDLIIVDAYHDMYVPFHLASAEFFEACRRRLRPGGVLAANVLTWRGEDHLQRAVAATLASVFEHVALLDLAPAANRVLFAAAHPLPLGAAARGGSCLPPAHAQQRATVLSLARRLRPWRPAPGDQRLTDDLAPVELLTHRMLLAAVAAWIAGPPVGRQPAPRPADAPGARRHPAERP